MITTRVALVAGIMLLGLVEIVVFRAINIRGITDVGGRIIAGPRWRSLL